MMTTHLQELYKRKTLECVESCRDIRRELVGMEDRFVKMMIAESKLLSTLRAHRKETEALLNRAEETYKRLNEPKKN